MLATRRLKKRSLLEVNEHFLDKVDDTDDPLSQEIKEITLSPSQNHPYGP